MRLCALLWCLYRGLAPYRAAEGHSYVFSKEYEEMRDQVFIYIQPELITVQYESAYYGQIAPHIRNMIDMNGDTVLTEGEVARFFTEYTGSLGQRLRAFPILVDQNHITLKIADVVSPTILTDSLLAPLRLRMVFKADSLFIGQGLHRLSVDPELLFLNGTQFIEMAKQRVAFTLQQERAIGRYLQISVMAAPDIEFERTYPGYIKKDQEMVRIYGVFYDETVLRVEKEKYPKLQIEFKRM